MPIKFRCQHCQQFLGIARAKAGSLADCPTCGRTIRVPQLDGSIQPLPKPTLDLADSNLAQALEELAQLGNPVADPHAPASNSDEVGPAIVTNSRQRPTEDASHILSPEKTKPPAPEKISIAPPLPAVRVSQSTKKEKKKKVAPTSQAAIPHDYDLLHDDRPASLAFSGRSTQYNRSVAAPASEWRALLSTPVLSVLICIAAIAFGLGFMAGNRNTPQQSTAYSPPSPRETAQADTPQEPAATNLAAQAAPPSVRGRITYRTDDGQIRPDNGARIIVLPVAQHGQTRLSIVGLRSSDSIDEFDSAQARLRTIGGDTAIVGVGGEFEIQLENAAAYHILVLSHYRPRDEAAVVDADFQNIYAGYFDRPLQLIGRVSYHFEQIRYQGTGTVIWDHSFNNPS